MSQLALDTFIWTKKTFWAIIYFVTKSASGLISTVSPKMVFARYQHFALQAKLKEPKIQSCLTGWTYVYVWAVLCTDCDCTYASASSFCHCNCHHFPINISLVTISLSLFSLVTISLSLSGCSPYQLKLLPHHHKLLATSRHARKLKFCTDTH